MSSIDNQNWNATPSLTDGSKTVNFYCNDSFGNNNNTGFVSFTINTSTSNPPSSGGGGGTPSAWEKTYVVSEEQIQEGYSKELEEAQRFNFPLYEEVHNLGVEKINETWVNISIFSDKIYVKMIGNEIRKFNLTNSGYYDLYVRLNDINNNKANITIKQIWEQIPGEPVIYINECQALTQKHGVYILNRSLEGGEVTANCIDIQANNITLDCQGNSIINHNLKSNIIYVLWKNKITIKNCQIEAYLGGYSWEYDDSFGIRMYGDNNIIENNLIRHACSGISIYGNNNTVKNNLIEDTIKALGLRKDNNIAKNNLIINNRKAQGWGLSVWDGKNNKFVNNKVENNDYGIVLYQADNSVLKCDSYSNSRDIYVYGVPWYKPLGEESNKNITAINVTYITKYVGKGAEFIELDGECDVDCSWENNSCIGNFFLNEYPYGEEKVKRIWYFIISMA